MNRGPLGVIHWSAVFRKFLTVSREFCSCLTNDEVVSKSEVGVLRKGGRLDGVNHVPFTTEIRSSCRRGCGAWTIPFVRRAFGRLYFGRGRRGLRCPLVVWRIPLVYSIEKSDGAAAQHNREQNDD